MCDRLMGRLARTAACVPSSLYRRELMARLFERDPAALLAAIGPTFNRTVQLDGLAADFEPDGRLEFEDLAGLFASNSLNHGIVSMTIRQGAYLFGLARRLPARRAIEIGRWRGGSTLLLAAAMPAGRLWSIDVGAKEVRLRPDFGTGAASFDDQLRRRLARHGLDAELLVGDSRTIELETGEVDLVLIDGDHSYETVRSDFERFGRRVRTGGAVLFDDAFDESIFRSHTESVGQLVDEIVQGGDFRLVRVVDRLAHLERVR